MTCARVTTGPSAGFGPVAVAALPADVSVSTTVVGSGCLGSEATPEACAGPAAPRATTHTVSVATSARTGLAGLQARRRRRLVAAVTRSPSAVAARRSTSARQVCRALAGPQRRGSLDGVRHDGTHGGGRAGAWAGPRGRPRDGRVAT